MLIGTYVASLSAKRRVAVPSTFRKILGASFIAAKWYEGCLILVSKENWTALLNKLTGKNEIITQPVRDTERFILGSAYEMVPDGQGRVVLPARLAQYGGLEDKAVFVGLGDRVEVWERQSWEKREQYVSQNASKFIEQLSDKDDK